MKWILYFLLVLLLFPGVDAETRVFEGEALDLELSIGAELDLVQEKRMVIDTIRATLLLRPLDTWQQEVLSISVLPQAISNETSFVFTWSDDKNLRYKLKTNVRVKNAVLPISSKVTFPLSSLPKGMEQYLIETPNINVHHPKIQQLAAELAGDEDDAYEIVFRIGNFTHNYIQYDLSQLGQKRSAIWILENKGGVCGDFSSLFLALVRALGIPARYVTGVAYTEVEGSDSFVPHAWTEVFFPEYGWVPFDPTYGQFGYVDASHIKLQDSSHATSNSVEYYWIGRGFTINTKPLEFDGSFVNVVGTESDMLDMEVKALYSTIGFESFQYIVATLKNPNPYYVGTTVELVIPDDVNVEETSRAVLLRPLSSVDVVWPLSLPALQSGFTYTYPFIVFTERNQSAEGEFLVEENGLQVSQDFNVRAEFSNLDCEVRKQNISCTVPSPGIICFQDNCQEGLNAEFNVDGKPGMYQGHVSATINEKTEQTPVIYTIRDLPSIEVKLDAPATLHKDDTTTIGVTLTKTSYSTPQNVRLEFLDQILTMEQLQHQKEFSFEVKGNDLGWDVQPIVVSYQDTSGIQYYFQIPIALETLGWNWWDKFIHWFKKP